VAARAGAKARPMRNAINVAARRREILIIVHPLSKSPEVEG
jgi:hypothetical protein